MVHQTVPLGTTTTTTMTVARMNTVPLVTTATTTTMTVATPTTIYLDTTPTITNMMDTKDLVFIKT